MDKIIEKGQVQSSFLTLKLRSWSPFFTNINIISSLTGMVINFLLQKKYVFELNRKVRTAFILSLAVSFGGIFISTSIIHGLKNFEIFQMYPIELTIPMAKDLTDFGFQELKSENEVIDALENSEGTALLVVNSVCGCAAANARPGAKIAIQNDKKPAKCYTVFAGVDKMATEKARESGFMEELAKASPLGRGGEPREMAEWVMMAGGPKNTYMTGENIIVSGGYIYA